MTSNADRNQPRELTIEELWDCWPEIIDPPELPAQRCRVLQSECPALNEVALKDYERPSLYPTKRSDYDPRSNKELETNHYIRFQKLYTINAILDLVNARTRAEQEVDNFATYIEERKKNRLMQESWPEKVKSSRSMLIKSASQGSGNANDVPLILSIRAWLELLPYHVDAFPKGTDRLEFASNENSILENIAWRLQERDECRNYSRISDRTKGWVYEYYMRTFILLNPFGLSVSEIPGHIELLEFKNPFCAKDGIQIYIKDMPQFGSEVHSNMQQLASIGRGGSTAQDEEIYYRHGALDPKEYDQPLTVSEILAAARARALDDAMVS
ncbi:uncharacterized protein L201_005279 [Kwoniella dendrophila CBS 6074]|uniref:HNH nuclease domain-containing protein n=1 Tax=Kwoniella dendrophila CBS 6074 TaxID=1295534 RepID=A0AAX4JY59_9TREE